MIEEKERFFKQKSYDCLKIFQLVCACAMHVVNLLCSSISVELFYALSLKVNYGVDALNLIE